MRGQTRALVDRALGIQFGSDIRAAYDVTCEAAFLQRGFDEFDLGQIVLGRKYKKKLDIPVVYYFQLLGLAQGLKPEEVGLSSSRLDRIEPVMQSTA